MTFEEFEKDMNVVLAFIKESDRWQDFLSNLLPKSSIIMNFGYPLLEAFVDKIESSFPYTENSKWINYYIYECNCGKSPMTVKYNDGTEIKLDSISKLYAIISFVGVEND